MSWGSEEELISARRQATDLEKENAELKMLLEGANELCSRIGKLVNDHGQYRDLEEAVSIALQETYERGKLAGKMSLDLKKFPSI